MMVTIYLWMFTHGGNCIYLCLGDKRDSNIMILRKHCCIAATTPRALTRPVTRSPALRTSAAEETRCGSRPSPLRARRMRCMLPLFMYLSLSYFFCHPLKFVYFEKILDAFPSYEVKEMSYVILLYFLQMLKYETFFCVLLLYAGLKVLECLAVYS